VPVTIVRQETIADGLVECEYASGKVVHKSIVYFDDTQQLKTLQGLNRTQAKKAHRDRQHAVDKGERTVSTKTLLQVRDEAFAYAQEMLDAGVENPPLAVGSLRNHRSAWNQRIDSAPIAKRKLTEITQADALPI